MGAEYAPKDTIVCSTPSSKGFGTSNERAIKRLLPLVEQINAIQPAIQALSDDALRSPTVRFRERIAVALTDVDDPDARIAAEKNNLGEILPEALAVVREPGRRTVGMRTSTSSSSAASSSHSRKISEMKTGEGKTLVATLPCYLNALAGHGVLVVTVNDYLAKRDAEWMGELNLTASSPAQLSACCIRPAPAACRPSGPGRGSNWQGKAGSLG